MAAIMLWPFGADFSARPPTEDGRCVSLLKLIDIVWGRHTLSHPDPIVGRSTARAPCRLSWALGGVYSGLNSSRTPAHQYFSLLY